MHARIKIQSHAHNLISLATLGALAVTVLGFLNAGIPYLPQWQPGWLKWDVYGLSPAEALALSPVAKPILSAAVLCGSAADVVPLLALRRLAVMLHRHDPLSRPVAATFRWLAHSLPLYALVNLGAWVLACVAREVGGDGGATFTLDFSVSYLFLVACLCLYSVAHVMQLAAETADDARSIV